MPSGKPGAFAVGLSVVGTTVGAAVGAAVGTAVGETVSSHVWLACKLALSQPAVHM